MTDVAIIVGLGNHESAHELAYQALQHGARSILALPSTGEQLLSAVRSCGIRAAPMAKALEVGVLRLDPQSFRATVEGRAVDLTPREFLMMQHLMLESPRVVSVEELARSLATYDDGSISATRVLVTRCVRSSNGPYRVRGSSSRPYGASATGSASPDRMSREPEPVDEVVDVPTDLVADRAHVVERATERVGDLPVHVTSAGVDRARIAAPHRDDDVGRLHDLVGQRLRELVSRRERRPRRAPASPRRR